MSGAGRSDAELVEACLDGDAEAWSALLDRFRGLIYSVPVRFGMRGDRADEVFQRTCVSILKGLRNLREVRRLAGWISTTAANHARMLLREERGRVDVDPRDVAPPAIEDTSAGLRRLEEAQILRTGLERLDPRCRSLLEILFFEPRELSYQEISERLGLPVGSIGPTRGRCLERLRRLMRESGFEE